MPRRPVLWQRTAVQERQQGGLRLFLEVREVDEAAHGRLRHIGRALHVLAAIEGRHQAPVMRLFDLASEWMVVALGAVDPSAVDDRGDGLGDHLMVIAAFIQEPRRPLCLGAVGPGDQHLANRFIPGAVRAEGVLKKRPPAVLPAPVFMASSLDAAHQKHIPQFAHPHGIVI